MRNPETFYTSLQPSSIRDNFIAPTHSIAALKNTARIGELVIKALLNVIITDVVLFFEVGKTMGRSQVIQTVELILEDYGHFKPEDFKLCFSRAKKGHYGKLFDRLDGQIILEWLMQYDNERDGEIEAVRAQENRELKKLEAAPILLEANSNPEKNDMASHYLSLIIAEMEERKAAKRRSQIEGNSFVKANNYSYQLHQRWIKQFDDLMFKQRGNGKVRKYGMVKSPFATDGGKMIPRMLNINDYLEYKQNQYNKFNKVK